MKKTVALVLVVVMMLAFGATAFAAQEPRTTVNCSMSFGDGLYFPDDDPHDDHDDVELSYPKDPYDYHHNGDGGLYFPE